MTECAGKTSQLVRQVYRSMVAVVCCVCVDKITINQAEYSGRVVKIPALLKKSRVNTDANRAERMLLTIPSPKVIISPFCYIIKEENIECCI